MSGRPVVERIEAVVKTACGNRMHVKGSGNAAAGMKTVFICFDRERRQKLLDELTKAHTDMIAREIAGGSPPDAPT